MKRGDFLRRFGLGITAAVVAPGIILKAIEAEKIPEIELKLESRYIKSKTLKPRTLKTSWTPETAKDLEFYYGLDAEQELTMLMGEEIKRKIDEEILKSILI